MKHEDLKVGMKVNRKEMYAYPGGWEACSGNVVTVKDWDHKFFSVEEEEKYPGMRWDPEYFEAVEETKGKETMQDTTKNLITMDKKYKTRCGFPARVICTDLKNKHYPVIVIISYLDEEHVVNFTSTGCESTDGLRSDLDLIEVSPYEDFKKDDKVMVREEGNEKWNKRYFAYEKDGVAHVFRNGCNSWSAENAYDTVVWDYCRKPTQEELGE